jgi:hypothetical protein
MFPMTIRWTRCPECGNVILKGGYCIGQFGERWHCNTWIDLMGWEDMEWD